MDRFSSQTLWPFPSARRDLFSRAGGPIGGTDSMRLGGGIGPEATPAINHDAGWRQLRAWGGGWDGQNLARWSWRSLKRPRPSARPDCRAPGKATRLNVTFSRPNKPYHMQQEISGGVKMHRMGKCGKSKRQLKPPLPTFIATMIIS